MILLVEDNRDDVFIMKRALRGLPPVTLHVASNGREAIDYLQGAGKYSDRAAFPLPSLIFLDLKLPVVHGFEVLAWIKGQQELKRVPIAILTSSPEERDRDRALQLGASIFLIKPPTTEALQNVLKHYLN